MTLIWTPDPNFKRATRPMSLARPLDCQDVSRFQAGTCEAAPASDLERLRAWFSSRPFAVGFVIGASAIAAAWLAVTSGAAFVELPDGALRQSIVALVLAPAAVAASVWAFRRLA